MATMKVLCSRADQLRRLGLSSHRAFRVLRAEFPHADRDMLVNAAQLPGAHNGITPGWALWGRALRPTQIRFKQKGRPEETHERPKVVTRKLMEREKQLMAGPVLSITIPVQEIRSGDLVLGIGVVDHAYPEFKGKICVFFESGDAHFFVRDTKIEVLLEDLEEKEESC